ncbi:hypothetical protein ABPG75_013482 [Micractinium tetrahymenae]
MVLLSALDHPHVVKFREAFLSSDGTACVAMELLRGGTLAEAIKRQKARGEHLPEEVVWRLFLQVASAVRYLHANRVCHRDLKPSNIMFSDSSGSVLKIVDFGLSKFMRTHLTNTLVGTPCYAAPEVFQWQPYGFACDIWSLGCILHELAALELAFQAESMRQLRYKVLRGVTAPLPPHYSQELRDTLALLLTTDPAQRITVEQLLALPHVARRLQALQQAGLVDGGRGGAAHAATLASALARLETQTSAEMPRTASSMDPLMVDLLPPPRYSKERQEEDAGVASPRQQAPMPTVLQAALSSDFYSSGASTPTHADSGSPAAASVQKAPVPAASEAAVSPALYASSGAGSATNADTGSPAALQHAAALAALAQGSPLQRPGKAAAGSAAGHVLVHAHSAPSVTTASPVSTPKLHPKYAALVAASDAASRRGSTKGGDRPASAPASPPMADVRAAAARGAPAGVAGGSRFRPDRASGSGAPRQQASRPGSAGGGSAGLAAALRLAVATSIRQQEEAMLRHVTERLSRLATPSASAGPTPRISTAAAAAGSVRRLSPCPPPQQPLAGGSRTEVAEMQLDGRSPGCPSILCPESSVAAQAGAEPAGPATPLPAQQAAAPTSNDAGSNDAGSGSNSSNSSGGTSGSTSAAAAPTKRRRVWRLLRLLHCRREDK